MNKRYWHLDRCRGARTTLAPPPIRGSMVLLVVNFCPRWALGTDASQVLAAFGSQRQRC